MIHTTKLKNDNYIAPALYDGGTSAWWDFTDVSTITKDVNNLVYSVTDKSGNNKDLTQSTLSSRPLWTKNFVFFDSKTMQTSSFTLNQPTTIYLVVKANWTIDPALSILFGGITNCSFIRYRGFVSFYAGDNIYGRDMINGHYYVIRIILNGSDSYIKMDDSVYNGNSGNINLDGIKLGSLTYSSFYIKEMIVRNKIDSDVDEINIYNYLKEKHLILPYKYSLSLGLRAFYEFKDNILDSSGYNNNGINTGAPKTVDYNGDNSAYYFDGNNWIDCGNNNSVHVGLVEEMSISTWFYKDQFTDSTNRGIVSNGNWGGNENGWAIIRGIDNKIYFSTNNAAGSTYNTTSGRACSDKSFVDNSWHHVVCVKKYENSKYNNYVYIDGIKQLTSQSNTEITSNSGWRLMIGAGAGDFPAACSTKPWQGGIGETRLYNRSLNDDEISYLYNNTKNSYVEKNTLLDFNIFISPSAWTSSSQYLTYGEEINIHKVFCAYNNVKKSYIYSIPTSYDSLTLSTVAGVSYRIGYVTSGVFRFSDITNSSTNPFPVGSTHRYVIVNQNSSSCNIPVGSTWAYLSRNITSINANGNNTIKYIHIESVSSITQLSSFVGCSQLKGTLMIPVNVTVLPNQAFQNCNNLNENLILNENLTSIGDYCFYINNGLTPTAMFSGSTLNLPNSLKSIGVYTFLSCLFVGDLIIPDSILNMYTTSSVGTFNGFSGGTLTIGRGIKIIYDSVFSNIPFVGDLIISDNVTSIGTASFANTKFSSLSLGNSITSIGLRAFQNCTSFLNDIVLPDSLITLGAESFFNCNKITSVAFGSSLTNIPNNAFQNCSSLNSITFSPNSKITSIDSVSFNGCKLKGNILIPEGVITLGFNSFGDGISPSNTSGYVSIPSTCTLISDYFMNVGYGMTKLEVWANVPPTITANSIYGLYSLPMHIPFGSLSLYRADSNWNSFTTIIEDLNVPTLQFNSFVSPSGFTDSSMFATYGETVDIFSIYSTYLASNSSAKAIYSVANTSTTTILKAIVGRSYYYAQEVSGNMVYNTITPATDYTLNWTSGSLKRYVIVKDIGVSVDITFPLEASWIYTGFNVKNCIAPNSNGTLAKYIHYHDLSKMSTMSAYGYAGLLSGDMTIPDGVVTLGGYVALGDSNMNGKLTIPSTLQFFGVGYILWNSYFSDISIPISNYFSTDGNAIFSKNGKILYAARPNMTSYTVPSEVTEFGSFAFFNSSLSELIFPDTFEKLGQRSIEGLSNLLSFTAPLSMTNLDDNYTLLGGANKLDSVYLHKNILNIRLSGFSSNVITYIKADMLIPTLNSGFNSTVKSNAKLYVPSASVPLYRSHSDWGQFTHSNINDGEVVGFDKFISNPNFNDPDDYATYGETVNIYNIYWNYYQTNPNAKYAYTVATATSPITLSELTGVSYRWSETYNGTDYVYDVTSGTAFTPNSTNRYIIYNDISTSPISCNVATSSWVYCGNLIKSFGTIGGYMDNYVHFSNINTLTNINGTHCVKSGNIINIPINVTYIDIQNSQWSFGNYYASYNVDPNNIYYASIDGVLYNKSITTIHSIPKGYKYSHYTVPDGVYSMSVFATNYSAYPNWITFPSSFGYFNGFSITSSSLIRMDFNLLLPPLLDLVFPLIFNAVPSSCVIHIKTGANVADWRAIPQFNFFTTILADL